MKSGNIKDLEGLEIEDSIDDLEDIGENRILSFFKKLLPYVIILVVVVIIRTYIVTPIIVSGESMAPTLNGGEVMILNKLDDIERYKIVVVKINSDKIIKRVIAMPGESISCENGVIFVNDKRIEEEYGDGVTPDFERIVLEDDEYFVLGDNRANSLDSSELGPMNVNDIEGTTKLVLFPFNEIGNVK